MPVDPSWWSSLDAEWKGALRKQFEFEGEPTDADLARIAGATHLRVARSNITSFAPITGLTNVVNVDFSGCKALTSYAGLPPSVQCVTFHWLQMDDLSWVDAYPNLETGFADKDLQRKVKLRISKNRRARKA